jgi:lipopolysaccharide/colanic/teichoic acid biosynthesis glycosyltransferase
MWAGVSPILAFLVRDGTINRIDNVAIYCGVALVASLVVFQWFKISSAIPNFFSIHDAWRVTQACVTTAALTAVIIFIFTRLEDAPRSIPIIHFLILGCGLIGTRVLSRLAGTRHAAEIFPPHCEDLDNILVIGATRQAWFFSRMVEEFTSHEQRIVAILDESPSLFNRTLNGYSIVGSPENLSKIIDEYATHGINIGKVVLAVHPKDLMGATRKNIFAICTAKNIPIEWFHEKLSLSQSKSSTYLKTPAADLDYASAPAGWSYCNSKRLMDVAFALIMMIPLAPLTMLVAALVSIDVGFPIVFWQQRIGHVGRPFHVYKFRTMRSSFDREGRPIPETKRLSLFGLFLRRNRLDEIPQLVNILMGNMSVVGPRPLLPIDQPKNIRLRLQIRPGLTGLAQINGGTLLTSEEKDAIDEWYIKNATVLLDIKIMVYTVWIIVRGNRRNESVISMAIDERNAKSGPAIETRSSDRGISGRSRAY